MSNVKLKWAPDSNGVMRHVDSVANGLECGCFCPDPSCREQLVARQGKVVDSHFAHYTKAECDGASESALHLLAKEIIGEAKQIWLPEVSLGLTIPNATRILSSSKMHTVTHARVENHTGTIVPDVILTIGEVELIVEVYVTHAVGVDKVEKIKRLGISAIEIDLSGANICNRDDLKRLLVGETGLKRWLHSELAAREATQEEFFIHDADWVHKADALEEKYWMNYENFHINVMKFEENWGITIYRDDKRIAARWGVKNCELAKRISFGMVCELKEGSEDCHFEH